MPHTTLFGGPCYTASESRKLLLRVNAKSDIPIKQISGQWLYFLDTLTTRDLDNIRNVLPSTSRKPTLGKNGEHCVTIYITPRNISPWSSQATSIAHVCGLESQVNRIERGRSVVIEFERPYDVLHELPPIRDFIHDRMTEKFDLEHPDLETMFSKGSRMPIEIVDIFANESGPFTALQAYSTRMGLGLDRESMEFLAAAFKNVGRPPNDIELFMWAQSNSNHCRHHDFNTTWIIDGETKDKTMFEMIKNTHKETPDHVVSAYSDNAAVLGGRPGSYWSFAHTTRLWGMTQEHVCSILKTETHCAPTAISPFPGAATGSGGEIRDEGSVGRGSSPKAGLVGFWTSDLMIPLNKSHWEKNYGKPFHYASALDVMLEAPIGASRYNKPQHALKIPGEVYEGAHVIVLGGPAFMVGLGGGAASSKTGSEGNTELDFNSVQRGNAEVERRAQMVIDSCCALGAENPIAFIHDVGAGGLSNAIPEILKDAGFGGKCELRRIESADPGMSPLQIWCNEAQERYVLLVNVDALERFESICQRERCGFSDIGTVVAPENCGSARLVLTDSEPIIDSPIQPIDMPMQVLFPPSRRIERSVQRIRKTLVAFDAYASLQETSGAVGIGEMITKATELIFHLPSVGSKGFLITIGDRTVGGLTVRDQLVGPWQTPVADVGVTLTSFSFDGKNRGGEAIAMGERPTLALISPAAASRMALCESLLNLAAADIMGAGRLKRVKLSANWMAAVNHPGDAADLYDAVEALGMEICPKLGVSIPVGKDSMSMKASWKDKDTREAKDVTSPISLVVSAFAPVDDVRRTWTPQLRRTEEVGESTILYVDLAQGHKAMGGGALAQCLSQIGDEAPDVRDVQVIKDFCEVLQNLHKQDLPLAYHDISDGGIMTTISEMMFAGRCGVDVSIDSIVSSGSGSDVLNALFTEELGAVFQIRESDETNFKECFASCGLPRGLIKKIGFVKPIAEQSLTIRDRQEVLVEIGRDQLQSWWTKTSFTLQSIRDNPTCAEAEYSTILDHKDPGLSYNLSFNPADRALPLPTNIRPLLPTATRPRVAVLREQGCNSHREIAFAFKAAGFDSVDVHMSDVISGSSLESFRGLCCSGGFSFSDVLGAGQGWAKSVLLHAGARATFSAFFNRPDTFTLGVCNGCQMLTRIKELIPGAESWPTFVENTSQQFEARFSMIEIADPGKGSVFFDGMGGSSLPIVVSHGEGRAEFSSPDQLRSLNEQSLVPMRYIDNYGAVTEAYPANPNGSPEGIAGVTSRDGRVLALMPHPERTIMADVGSWAPSAEVERWGAFGPWERIFVNARRWIG
ncbi:MAG: hypothetical protein L6R42_000415 [Xanthoria sp. 1 TBL-2021]|nr:MAG: hypothetical protein L6R42_000415 [Xanthoria sp. 1 TBL-2021]